VNTARIFRVEETNSEEGGTRNRIGHLSQTKPTISYLSDDLILTSESTARHSFQLLGHEAGTREKKKVKQ
jgi:hypothetical protein